MNRIPTVLFTYNRPDLLRQTLESLSANTLAGETDLIVYADGPKENATADQLEKIQQVRSVIREKKWCKSITVYEAEKNKGLARSVIEGVTATLQKSELVIVLEDDVLLSPFFLQYMNDALTIYKDEPTVFAIGAWTYFTRRNFNHRPFFMRYPDSIAWGTFKRSWEKFEYDPQKIKQRLITENKLSRFNGFNNLKYFEPMLDLYIQGKIDSWAIRWTATSILENGLTLFPPVSMVKHMGFDQAGTHERMEDYNVDLPLANEIAVVKKQEVIESVSAFTDWKNFILNRFLHSDSRKVKLMNRLKESLPRFIFNLLFA